MGARAYWTYRQAENVTGIRGHEHLSEKASHRQRNMLDGKIKYSKIKEKFERERGNREHEYTSYNMFRAALNEYGPDGGGAKHCSQVEWDLYLRPGTAFDFICRRYYEIEVFKPMVMVLITHKSDKWKLKRIEAIPHREEMRILWSEA